jgi:hypothetical protein
MATASLSDVTRTTASQLLSVRRLVAVAGLTLAIVFVLCWLGTFLPLPSPTHVYIGLFTPAAVNSFQALLEGTLWSLLFGAILGGLFAVLYNLSAGLDRK